MKITITPENQSVISALMRAESVVKLLSDKGITVLNVSMCSSKPRIRIARHSYCERLIRNGKASYLHIGNGRNGHYKQGVFEQLGCRIYWSESLH